MQKFTPDWHYEAAYDGPIAGIDEAGRGPLAGPVVTAAVILDKNNIPAGLNDSKKLSSTKRDILFEQLFACAHIGIGIAEPEEIDRLNVLGATLAAMARSADDLTIRPIALLVDGNKAPTTNIPTQTIIKGDAKSLSIAAASIIAKVTRDRLMEMADIRFPGYDFSRHKGYPTALHREYLHSKGACPLHRRSYAPVKAVLT
jgi:ribonuclease HII